MTKFTSLKKVHTKIIMMKRNLELNDLGFSVITCPGFYRLIFQSLYDTSSLISPKWEIDETVNFHNFCKFFTNKCDAFFGYFGTLFSNG